MSLVINQSPVERLTAHFEQELPSLYGDAALRREAMATLREKGIPDRKWEDYKNINPAALFKQPHVAQARVGLEIKPEAVALMVLQPGSALAVVVNGELREDLSKLDRLPAGIRVKSIADAVVSDAVAREYYNIVNGTSADPFVLWNNALNKGGVFIHVDKNVQSEVGIHVLHISTNEVAAVSHPRNLFVIERDAQIEIVESFETLGPVKTFTNALTEVVVHQNAIVDHYRMQLEGQVGHQMNTVNAVTQKGSNYRTYTFTLDGAWVRNNLNIRFSESHAEAHLFGLTMLNGQRVADHHTIVDHAIPNCMSNELYKGVLDDKSLGVFNGKIFVRRDAQKTNAYQTNRNILLSDDAQINTKPQLEIYADDVKCSHGTSTGRMDEDALFYLRARGIGEAAARKLLVRAFAEEVVTNVPNDAIRAYVENRLDHFFN